MRFDKTKEILKWFRSHQEETIIPSLRIPSFSRISVVNIGTWFTLLYDFRAPLKSCNDVKTYSKNSKREEKTTQSPLPKSRINYWKNDLFRPGKDLGLLESMGREIQDKTPIQILQDEITYTGRILGIIFETKMTLGKTLYFFIQFDDYSGCYLYSDEWVV